jgi:hypothetical protein
MSIMAQIVSLLTLPLRSHARAIRSLSAKWGKTTFEIAAEVSAAHKKALTIKGSHKSDWTRWCRQEAGISSGWARKLVRIHRKFGDVESAKSLSHRILLNLTKPDTPAKAIDEILSRASKGEKVISKKAKRIIDSHRPTPKAANEKAMETGKPVLASDGYLYFGNTKEEAKAGEERRTVVYSVREAIETLATVQWTAEDFLKQALPHQLWKPREDEQIEVALRWLSSLSKAWNRRNIDHERPAIEDRTNGGKGVEARG